jgi:LPS-assembly lipoprotein
MLRRRFALAGFAMAIGGCGFELRRPPELRFRSIYLRGFGTHSPLAQELRRTIAASTTTRVVDSPTEAEVVLDALADTREKGVVASTAAGQVREVQLRVRFRFQLRTPADKMLIAPDELILRRDMSYNETAALAKEQEEQFLYRAMQSDIVAQVLRRLAAVQGV